MDKPDPVELTDATAAAVVRLRAAGCVMPEAEVEAATATWAGRDPARLLAELDGYVRRRELGEPPAYILGGTTFLGRWLAVGPGAFVPRPWTEEVARAALEFLGGAAGVLVDVGTGAGPLALALALGSPKSRVWATEVDPGALVWARHNLDPLDNVTVIEGSLLEPLPRELLASVDLVAGCLPYVPAEAVAEMPRDFREHEPAVAFDGGPGGLALVARALAEARSWLRPGGRVVLEIGAGQGRGAVELATGLGYIDAEARRDADGDDAMLVARAPTLWDDRRLDYVKDPRVDDYIDALPDWQQAICNVVRDLVHAAAPEVEETIKRTRQPYFVLHGNVCALLTAKDHVNVFLYDGAMVPDPEGIITAGHDNLTARTVGFRRGDVINGPALLAMFRQIIANNRAGGWRKLKA